MPVSGGYDNIYDFLRPRLRDCDFREAALRLGLTCRGGRVPVTFLGREYLITAEGVEPADGGSCHPNTRSVLAYYILSPGAGALSGEFAPLHRLTGMIEGRNQLGGDMMNTPLRRRFGADPEAFRQSAASIGGEELPGQSGGKRVWQFAVLPKLRVRVIHYPADTEFPAEFQIQFDSTAPRFLEFECLAFLTGCLVHALLDKAP